MKILHICDGWEKWNGAANIARLIAGEQAAAGHETVFRRWAGVRELRAADEVWLHCGWTPCLWWGALWGRNVRWMPEACYDPMRLKYHAWKKRLVGPIERRMLRRAARVVATCAAEAEWIRAYLGGRCPPIAVEDIRRFFSRGDGSGARGGGRPLHVLYLGRRHPLKGVAYLERAVKRVNGPEEDRAFRGNAPAEGLPRIELRIVSDHFGEELERDWAWCDVLCLPTLSENFGLVIAEALSRGKRVVTTDGAPAWDPEGTKETGRDDVREGGREGEPGALRREEDLVYLRGYRDGSDEQRVTQLATALMRLLAG